MRKRRAAEALACIAFKQPISQAETEIPFAADKRRLLVKLRDLKLVEEFAGSDGRLHSCSASGLASLQESSASFCIASKNARWSMRPTILISPWHSGQRSGSASQTFLIEFGRSGRSLSSTPAYHSEGLTRHY